MSGFTLNPDGIVFLALGAEDSAILAIILVSVLATGEDLLE